MLSWADNTFDCDLKIQSSPECRFDNYICESVCLSFKIVMQNILEELVNCCSIGYEESRNHINWYALTCQPTHRDNYTGIGSKFNSYKSIHPYIY